MDTSERRAVAALWSLQGIGPVSIACIEREVGPLGPLLDLEVRQWLWQPALSAGAREALEQVTTLAQVADRLEAKASACQQTIIFPGDPGWPHRMIGDWAPRCLFMVGPGGSGPRRRRVAIVGTRRPEPGAVERVARLACELAGQGVGVVSGGAEGIDQAAHFGALRGRGETWAFLGSAFDELDPMQRPLVEPFLAHGGTFFSQYPPGTRADKSTFSRRNPLISGAADCVLIARAPRKSGALQTAQAAIEQARPLLVLPSDPWNVAAEGSNALIAEGSARPCFDVSTLLEVLGLKTGQPRVPPQSIDVASFSVIARRVLEILSAHPCDVDVLIAQTGLQPGEVKAALVELEVEGAVMHKGSGLWERP
jgi:DNA processing protein